MSSKKPVKTSLKRPGLFEILALLTLLSLVMLISIVTIFIRPEFPIRLNFVAVETITIQDNWNGLSDIAPIYMTYHLNFQNGALIGTGDFSIRREPDTYQQNNVPINIPADITQAFFNKLKEIQLVEGQYTPNIRWTDDYPSLSIAIDTRRENIELFSESQGERHIPWGAYIRDTNYHIESGIPADALAIIDPYLRKEVLTNLIAEARKNDEFNS